MFIGEIAALITALLWSFSSIIFTEASLRIGSQQLNINRLISAFFFLSILILIIGFPDDITSEQLFYLALSGLTGLAFGDAFLFKAFQTIGARYSMLIMSFAPGISALLSFIFLNEILSFQSIIGMVLTILGISIVVLEKKNGTNSKFSFGLRGFVFAFLGAVGQAVGLIFAKQAFILGEVNGFVATFIRIFCSIIVFLPFLLIIKKYKNPYKLYRNDLKSLYLTVAGSIVGPFLGITFSLIAVSYTEIGIASTLMATTPIMMLPAVKFIYKEKIPFVGILGTFFAVLGIAILFLR